MRTVKALLTMLSVVFLLEVGLLSPTEVAAQRCDPNRYRMDPKLRKKLGRDAMLKAMELNARAELMIRQGSEEHEKISKMLLDSYGYQIKAIGALEGLNREACFKDPLIERGIEEMYGQGKPATEQAAGHIKENNPEGALERLTVAKRVHTRFLGLMY